MYREMGMTYWLERAESRDHGAGLYEPYNEHATRVEGVAEGGE